LLPPLPLLATPVVVVIKRKRRRRRRRRARGWLSVAVTPSWSAYSYG
jgi:hypothetical protein